MAGVIRIHLDVYRLTSNFTLEQTGGSRTLATGCSP